MGAKWHLKGHPVQSLTLQRRKLRPPKDSSPAPSFTDSCQCRGALRPPGLWTTGIFSWSEKQRKPSDLQGHSVTIGRPLGSSLASGPQHRQIPIQLLVPTCPRTEGEKPGARWLTGTGSLPWLWSNHTIGVPRGCPSRSQVSSPPHSLNRRKPQRLCHGQKTAVHSSTSPEWVALGPALFCKHSGP